jgi:8-oxo-dGTP pyrophosphatase MutT (NUDIX family)
VVDGKDPDFLTAARRELAEETGYGGGRWSELMTLSANPALTTNLTHTFLAEGVEPLGDAAPDLTEDLRVHLMPVAEIAALIDGGDVIQALHAAPLLRYLLTRR